MYIISSYHCNIVPSSHHDICISLYHIYHYDIVLIYSIWSYTFVYTFISRSIYMTTSLYYHITPSTFSLCLYPWIHPSIHPFRILTPWVARLSYSQLFGSLIRPRSGLMAEVLAEHGASLAHCVTWHFASVAPCVDRCTMWQNCNHVHPCQEAVAVCSTGWSVSTPTHYAKSIGIS